MAGSSRLRFEIRGAKSLFKALDPAKVDSTIRSHIRTATKLNGLVGERELRKTIQKGMPPRNAALTQAIKGGDKPVVDSAATFLGITSQVVSDVEVFAGVLRTHESFNVAAIVHEGATVPVTPAMRGLFFSLWKASIGEMDPSELSDRGKELFKLYQGWLPLKDTTAAIVIPPRKWVDRTFARKGPNKQATKNWAEALKMSFRELAQTAKAGR